MKERNKVYVCEREKLNLFDLEKWQSTTTVEESIAGATLSEVDPHRNELVASA